MKYIYGSVPSWRLGRSLGVDLISGEKVCAFDCIYCQLGKTVRHLIKRGVFVPTSAIIKELESLPALDIDYITLSGTGEPTLAANLGEELSEIKELFKPLKSYSVYDVERLAIEPLDEETTRKRRPVIV